MIAIRFMITDGADIRELCGSFDAGATVLDALETLRVRQAGELSVDQAGNQSPVPAYRHSCHHGSCGTCGAIINGLEGLMCLTRLGELAKPRPGGPELEPELDAEGRVTVRLEPIRRGSLIAGIAARPTQALAGIPADLPYLMQLETGETGGSSGMTNGKAAGKTDLPGDPTRPAPAYGVDKAEPVDGMPPATGGPPARVRFEACIECGLCSSSCPVNVPFMGPAALAALNRQRQKNPENTESMLALAGTFDGAAACERHLACSRVCPQEVYPGKHIQLLKNALGGRT
ncbi:MAG: 2Fe-2S iron-sulfur cluster-binding protein [Clostridia bacterium]